MKRFTKRRSPRRVPAQHKRRLIVEGLESRRLLAATSFETEKLDAAVAVAGDQFGQSVGLDVDTGIVGSRHDDDGGVDAGSATIFDRDASGNWIELVELLASDSVANDQFGFSTSIDGNTAVVGALYEDSLGKTDNGAAYVFVRDGSGVWTQQAKLNALDAENDDRFGAAVDIDGDTIVVGAHYEDTGVSENGAAYVFTRTGTTWTQQQKLTAGDLDAGDQFGFSVSVDGDTALMGSYKDSTVSNSEQGSAYVFTRTGTTWSEQTKLTASDSAALDQFGWSVSLQGDTAVVGSRYDDNGGGANAGSAYVFLDDGLGNWSEQARLQASNAASNDYFGYGVSVSGDRVAVGAYARDVAGHSNSGSAYLFERDGAGSWTELANFVASNGAAGDTLGHSVAMDGPVILAGAPFADTSGTADVGAVYAFNLDEDLGDAPSPYPTTRTDDGAIHSITPGFTLGTFIDMDADAKVSLEANGDDNDGNDDEDGVTFGQLEIGDASASIDVFVTNTAGVTNPYLDAWIDFNADGDWNDVGEQITSGIVVSGINTIIFTVPEDAESGTAFARFRLHDGTTSLLPTGATNSGEVEDYRVSINFDINDPEQATRLLASDAASSDQFGHSVSIDGNSAIIGAHTEDSNGATNNGAAYIYTRDGSGDWSQKTKLLASDAFSDRVFGYAVSIFGDSAIVGAIASSGGNGAAYVFTRDELGDWSQQAKLLASDGANGDWFGSSVSIEGDTAVIGAKREDTGGNTSNGAVYVFNRNASGVWKQTSKLLAADAASTAEFGVALSFQDDVLVVGASGEDSGGNNNGSAYVFTRDQSGMWTQQTKLLANDAANFDNFGSSVSLGNGTVVLGAIGSDTGGSDSNGAAYVFTKDLMGAWTQQAKLVSADAATNDYFGRGVSVDGDVIVVGASNADSNGIDNRGAAYIFSRDISGVWTQSDKLLAADAAANDIFGFSVSLDGRNLLIGSHFGDSAETNSGSAYLFDLRTANEDLGDAPAPYPTLLIDDGPEHAGFAGFSLGMLWDDDDDGHPSLETNGDDTDGIDDEDGVTFGQLKIGDAGATVGVLVTNTAGVTNPYLDAWIDFNADGDWNDVGEQITSGAVLAGTNTITFTVPEDAEIGQAFARFRLHDGTNGLLPTGPADSGEVEDYRVSINFDVNNPEQVAMLFADDGATADSFGLSVAINGDYAIVGAFREDTGVNVDNGAVYIFERSSAGVWILAEKIVASNAATGDQFGISVALDGDWAVVGARFQDEGGLVDGGAAYVIHRDLSGQWSEYTRLVANDPQAGAVFGRSVAIDDDTLIVGSQTNDSGLVENGAAYVFVRNGLGVWTQQTKVLASNAGDTDRFGIAVGLDGDTAIVGAYFEDTGGTDAGAAYIFNRDANGGWSETTILRASDAEIGDAFGVAVDITGDRAIVGAYLEDFGGNSNNGAAYIFDRDASGAWNEQAILRASNAATEDHFGYSVAIEGDKAVVGTIEGDTLGITDSGAAYVFSRDTVTGVWSEVEQLTPDPLAATDRFGYVVDLDGDTVIAGAYLSDPGGINASGSAFLFDLNTPRQDLGDAPSPYPTLLAGDGPVHTEVAGFSLGANWDDDTDGQPSLEANGDDTNGIDDEDGVTFGQLKIGDAAATVDVFVTNSAGVTNPYLDAWIDFNADGDWDDAGEQIYSAVVVAGTNTLTFTVPDDAEIVPTFARFRLHDGNVSLTPTGSINSGEVEDYLVTLEPLPVTIVGTSPELNDGLLLAGTSELTIQFSRVVDTSSAVAPFSLLTAGNDGVLGNADDEVVPIVSAVYQGHIVTLGFSALHTNVYRFTIDDTLSGPAGDAIDGDGDGIEGGQYRNDFVIGTGTVSFTSPNAVDFDVDSRTGQLVKGPANVFDGLNRLFVDSTVFNSSPDAELFPAVIANTNSQLSTSFADVPGLTTSITLTEESIVKLDAKLGLSSTDNSPWSGSARFSINGIAETTAAMFANPYVLPSLSGIAGSSVVSVNPPNTVTTSNGSHNHSGGVGTAGNHSHAVGIGSFNSASHNHSISLAPVASARNLAIDAEDWVVLPAGTYTVAVQATSSGGVQFDGEQVLEIAKFAEASAANLTELSVVDSTFIPSTFADVPNLTTSITLTEESMVMLDARLGLSSTDNSLWSGSARFTIDGVAESTAATFANPYVLPSLSGTSGSSVVSINPPNTVTTSSGSHNHSGGVGTDGNHSHAVNIGSFNSASHNHSVSLAPVDSARMLAVDAEDWVVLPAGTYTIAVQATSSGSVQFDGEQFLSIVQFAKNASADVSELSVADTTVIPSSFAEVAGLTTSITLTDESFVMLDARLGVSTTDNSAWSGSTRFSINGVAEQVAATFANPYILPSLSGTTDSSVVSINPPNTVTTSNGSHNHSGSVGTDGNHSHAIDIGSFNSASHNHSVSLAPADSARTLAIEAEDWVILPAGTYTISVQAASSGVVSFDGQQTLSVSHFGTNGPTIQDIGSTFRTSTRQLSGLSVSREITVSSQGNESFARTIDVFKNSTGSEITATVQIVGNLGTDQNTVVFNTSDGDSIVETSDVWIGTDDADGSGRPAMIHYVHGPGGLAPIAADVVDDNIYWNYDLTVPAHSVARLAHLTLLNETRAGVEADASAIVKVDGFGGQVAAFLRPDELASLGNFFFSDYGDAPAPYSTLDEDDGPSHIGVSGFSLGLMRDDDGDGQPSLEANGDDTDGTDDEDGVTFGLLKIGDTATTVDVVVTNTAAVANPYLDAWLDFNADGDWDDAGESIYSGAVVDGTNVLSFAVPTDSEIGQTFARFRLHDGTTALLPTGPAVSGEVEDYRVSIGFDLDDPDQLDKLFASDAGGQSFFGQSVSVDGDTAIVGAYGRGSAYIFVKDASGVWAEQDRLTASDMPDTYGFGWSVSVKGNTAVVGASFFDDGALNEAGAAYVYTRDVLGNWTEQAKLTPSDLEEDDWFGYSVSVDGDTAVVGAYLADTGFLTNTGFPIEGTAYVFERDEFGVWNQSTKLQSTDPSDEYFGAAVSIDGDTLVVGAEFGNEGDGSAFIYTRDAAGVWSEKTELLNPGQNLFAKFGYTVALDGDTLIIGAPESDSVAHALSGASYVFVRDAAGDWSLQTKLQASDEAASFGFGWSVDVQGDTAVISAAFRDPETDGFQIGGVYVFQRDASGLWNEREIVSANDRTDAGEYGWAVALDGDTIFATNSTDNDNGQNAGAAYVVDLTTPEDDFGDAPSPYPTLLSDNGPKHEQVAGFSLGALWDDEDNGNPSPQANGDDNDGIDDEDGVQIVDLFAGNAAASLQLTVTNTAAVANPYLDAWIDFNADGDWDDAGEQIVSAAVTAGANTISFAVPDDAMLGQTFARFRLHDGTSGILPTGRVESGEVEDYAITITDEAVINLPEDSINSIEIRRDNDRLEIYDRIAESLIFDAPLVSVEKLTIIGSNSQRDVVNVRYLGTGAFSIPEGIHLIGGQNTDDQIIVSGTTLTQANFFTLMNPLGVTAVQLSDGTASLVVSFDEFDDRIFRDLLTFSSSAAVMSIGSGSTHIVSATPINLGNLTTIDGGHLLSSGTIALGSGESIIGHGWISGAFAGELGSLVRATGDLTIGDTFSHAGFAMQGALEVGEHNVILQDAGQAVLGSITTLGSNGNEGNLFAPGGILIDFGNSVVGHGNLHSPDDDNDLVMLNGLIEGDSSTDQITLTGYVKGVGTLSHVDISGTYSPGFSPAVIQNGSVTYNTSGMTVLEIAGTTPGSSGHDQIKHTGTANLGGDLNVELIDGFAPTSDNSFVLLTATGGITGAYSDVTLPAPPTGADWNLVYDTDEVRMELVTSVTGGSIQDYGDAPSPYPGLASHLGAGPQLGATRDLETQLQRSDSADGDGGDEDGVLFGRIEAGTGAGINVDVDLQDVAAGETARVDAWIDFNQDGDWYDAGERILTSAPVSSGLQTLNYTVPSGIQSGVTFARVRISTLEDLSPTGAAANGEVEDYLVTIGPRAAIELARIESSDPITRSEITAIEVEFDSQVDQVSPSDFVLKNTTTGEFVTGVEVSLDVSQTFATLTFTGGASVIPSAAEGVPATLANGGYQLRYRPASFEVNEPELAIDNFFRKYGDDDGSDVVGLADFAAFRATFGLDYDSGDPGNGFNSGLDANRDGVIGLVDFAAFRAGFGN